MSVSLIGRLAQRWWISTPSMEANVVNKKENLGVLGDLVVNLGCWEGCDSTILDSRNHHGTTNHRGRLGPQDMWAQP